MESRTGLQSSPTLTRLTSMDASGNAAQQLVPSRSGISRDQNTPRAAAAAPNPPLTAATPAAARASLSPEAPALLGSQRASLSPRPDAPPPDVLPPPTGFDDLQRATSYASHEGLTQARKSQEHAAWGGPGSAAHIPAQRPSFATPAAESWSTTHAGISSFVARTSESSERMRTSVRQRPSMKLGVGQATAGDYASGAQRQEIDAGEHLTI